MTAHAVHEHAGGSDPILFDECDRCAELAGTVLWSLDRETSAALWQRMVEVEKGGGSTPATHRHYASVNEARACKTLREVALFLERNSPINPWGWPLGAPLRPAV